MSRNNRPSAAIDLRQALPRYYQLIRYQNDGLFDATSDNLNQLDHNLLALWTADVPNIAALGLEGLSIHELSRRLRNAHLKLFKTIIERDDAIGHSRLHNLLSYAMSHNVAESEINRLIGITRPYVNGDRGTVIKKRNPVSCKCFSCFHIRVSTISGISLIYFSKIA